MFENVTQNDFVNYLKSNENVIVYFSSQHCGACKMQDPILERIQQNFSNQIRVARIETEKNPNLAMAYQILGTPTLMFFKKGNKVRFKSKTGDKIDRLVGAQELSRLQGMVNYLIKMKIKTKEDM